MNDLKPGWKTSEFWLTAVTSVLSILVMAGAIGPDDSSRLVALVKDVIAGVIALIGVIGYVAGRVKLKGGE